MHSSEDNFQGLVLSFYHVVPETKLRLPGLVAGAFTRSAITLEKPPFSWMLFSGLQSNKTAFAFTILLGY